MSFRGLSQNVNKLAGAVAADINNFGTELAKVIGAVNAFHHNFLAQQQRATRIELAQLVIDIVLAAGLAYLLWQ